MTIEFDGINNKLGTTTANSVTIKTNDTDAIIVNSSQNVGVGTTSPNKDGITKALTINSPVATNYSGIELSTADILRTALISNSNGGYLYTATDIPLVFQTNNVERARFTSAGLHIGGTGSANALDDYEEGTWTASLVGSSSNPSTAVTVTASYTKIGRYVYLAGQFSNVNTTGASGGVRITGMPFAPSGANVGGGVVTHTRFTFSGSNISPYATSTYIAFYQSVSGSAWSEITHSAGTGAYLAFGIIYITA